MGRIDVIIPNDLEKKLRMKAVEKFGGKKGSLTDALEEAIETWIDQPDDIDMKKARRVAGGDAK